VSAAAAGGAAAGGAAAGGAVAGGAARAVQHLVGDVQRLGLLSAAAVVDRYVDLVDGVLGGGPARSAPGASSGDARGLAQSAASLTQAWVGLVEATAALLPGAGGTGGGAEAGTAEPDEVRLPETAAGQVARGSLWLHNPTDHELAGVRVAATGLVAGDGSVVPASAVELDPCEVPRVAAGASVEVGVRVRVLGEQPPGWYHGVLVCSVAARQALPVALRVVPASEASA